MSPLPIRGKLPSSQKVIGSVIGRPYLALSCSPHTGRSSQQSFSKTLARLNRAIVVRWCQRDRGRNSQPRLRLRLNSQAQGDTKSGLIAAATLGLDPKSIRTFAGTLVNLKRFSGEPPLMGSPCVGQTTLAIAVVTYYRLSHVVLKAQC